MVNEDITTALKNAVINGESLQTAIQILINSGYNPREVNEASHYISQGAMVNLQSYPEESSQQQYQQQNMQLNQNQMQNSFQNQQQSFQKTSQVYQNQQMQNQLRQPSWQNNYQQPFAGQNLQQINTQNQMLRSPNKRSYTKEIILVGILIILLGILASTFIFRESILSFFG